MADVKEVLVRLKAVNDDFKKGMAEAGDSTAQFAKVSAVAMAAVGVAVAGLAVKAANETVDYGRSIMKLSRISGDSVEAMSKLAFAAQQAGGITTDQLGNGLKFMEKNAAAGNAEFDKLGVTVKETDGRFRSTHAIFLDTAEAISHLQKGTEQSAATLKIFGRAGLDLLPVLALGKKGILDLEEGAQKYGLVLSNGNVAAIKANIAAHREFDAALMGAKVQLGEQVLPALTAVTGAFAKLPGPVVSAILPVTGLAAGLVGVATVAPKVIDGVQKITGGMSGMEMAMSGVAVAGIAVVLKGMQDIEAESRKMQAALSGSIDWTDNAKATEGINHEVDAVNKMGQAWNNMSAAEKLANPGAWKIYNDAAAQLEQDYKHFDESTKRVKALGTALNVTTEQARAMATSVHVDLTQMDPSAYLPIFAQLAAGTISAAQAANQLSVAARGAGESSEDQAKHMEELRKETKAANDEEKAAIEPQYKMIDATKKVGDARRAITDAQRGVADANLAASDAADKVTAAEVKQSDATKKVTDALAAQQDAQKNLNDLLRGPTLDEKDSIEAASIALAESKRRQAGITKTDPELEKRKLALDVRRNELALANAEGAHDKAVDAAQKTLATANQAVLDANQAKKDSIRAVADANQALTDSGVKVADAQQKLLDAQPALVKALMDQDAANRDLNTAISLGEVSVDKSTEAFDRWVRQGSITRDEADKQIQKFKDLKEVMDRANPEASGSTPSDRLAQFYQNHPGMSGPVSQKTADDEYQNTEHLAFFYKSNPTISGPISQQTADAYWNANHHAMGGLLDEGWNLLGEQGPELVHKAGMVAHVATAPQTAGLLTPHAAVAAASPFIASTTAGAGGASSGPSYTHNGDIVIGRASESTARDVAWEQRKLALRMPAR